MKNIKKFVVVVLVLAIITMGCGGTAAVSTGKPQVEEVPIAPTAVDSKEIPIVPVRTITASDGTIFETPVPLPVATPTKQEDINGLSIYYYEKPIDLQSAGFVPVFGFAGIATTADGPLPFGDALGLVVVAGKVVAVIVSAIPVAVIAYDGIEDLQASLAFWQGLSAYIPVSPEHKEAHSVKPLSVGEANEATRNFAELEKHWPPQQGDNIKCFVLMAGDVVYRYVAWQYTNMSPGGTVERGAVSWWQYHPESGAEAFGYSGKSGATLDKVPSDLDASKFRMVPYDCNNMQPPFGLLYQ